MHRIVALIAPFLFALSAAAADLDTMIAKANTGDADAQYRLATMYSTGDGAPRDLDRAFDWYRKAARQGHIDAMYSLAIAYYNGTVLGGTLPRSLEKAWMWFNMAAERGDAGAAKEANRTADELGKNSLERAQYHLALALLNGEEVPRDVPRAITMLEGFASTNGDAALELAAVYEKGIGVPVNGEQAVRWLEQASRKGAVMNAQMRLAHLYLDGGPVQPNADAAEAACKKVAHTREGMMCMAIVAERRTPPDEVKAAGWYKKAAEAGSFPGMIQYGRGLAEGKGVKQDYAKAYFWLAVADIGSKFAETKKLLAEVTPKLSPEEMAKQDKAVAKSKVPPYPRKIAPAGGKP